MKQSIYILVLLSILTQTILSCKKSGMQGDLKSIPALSVITKDTVFTVQQLDTLKIPVDIQGTSAGNTSYSYNWKAYLTTPTANSGADPNFKPDTSYLISTQKDLQSIINLAPGAYFLQYTITDEKTNIKTFKRYQLNVNGLFYEGWFVVSNKNSKAMVSFIRKDDKVFANPITDINNVELKGKALAAYSGVISQLREVNVFTDQEVYRLQANSLVITGTTQNLFETPMTFTNPYYTVNYINTDQYIFDKGSIYGTIAPNFGSVGKYSQRFAGPDYELFPFLMPGSSFYVTVYDNKNKRFLQTSYNSRELSVFGKLPDANYDVTNVGKTMVAADRNVNREYYCVMKDNSGYFLYSINTNLASPAGIAQRMLNCPDIDKAVTFSASATLPLLYYAVENKIYLYDVSANAARLLYTFPAGTNVKDMELLKSKGWGTFTDPLINNRIVVAVYNGIEGQVYYFDLASTGDFVNGNYTKKFGGFGDIVQINYRNPNI
jgi:hypothetical protein